VKASLAYKRGWRLNQKSSAHFEIRTLGQQDASDFGENHPEFHCSWASNWE